MLSILEDVRKFIITSKSLFNGGSRLMRHQLFVCRLDLCLGTTAIGISRQFPADTRLPLVRIPSLRTHLRRSNEMVSEL